MTIPQEINAAACREQIAFAKFQREAIAKKTLNPSCRVIEHGLIVMKQQKIVAVPDIILDPQGLLDEYVQLVQIKISHPLAGIIPDRDVLPIGDTKDDLVE